MVPVGSLGMAAAAIQHLARRRVPAFAVERVEEHGSGYDPDRTGETGRLRSRLGVRGQ